VALQSPLSPSQLSSSPLSQLSLSSESLEHPSSSSPEHEGASSSALLLEEAEPRQLEPDPPPLQCLGAWARVFVAAVVCDQFSVANK
jgi:hypothetical protein